VRDVRHSGAKSSQKVQQTFLTVPDIGGRVWKITGFLIANVIPDTVRGWERKNRSARHSGRGPRILEREDSTVS